MNKTWKQPNLILGLITFLTLILSVGFRANRLNRIADILLISTFSLGLIHWIWAVIDVLKNFFANKAKEARNILWVILVVIVPPVGGILYYAFRRNVEI